MRPSYHGKGAVAEILTEVAKRGFSKAFVCCDPDLVKFGVSAKVTSLLEQAGFPYELYSNIKPNPTIENVQTGVTAMKSSGADCIIAIGGGSSMDTAKAVGIITANPEFADVRSLEGTAPTKNPSVPILAVPATAGTAAVDTMKQLSANMGIPAGLKQIAKDSDVPPWLSPLSRTPAVPATPRTPVRRRSWSSTANFCKTAQALFSSAIHCF